MKTAPLDTPAAPDADEPADPCSCPAVCAQHPEDDDDDDGGDVMAALAAVERARRDDAAKLRRELAQLRAERSAPAPTLPGSPAPRGKRVALVVALVVVVVLALAAVAARMRGDVA